MSLEIYDPRARIEKRAEVEAVKVLSLLSRPISIIDNSKPRFDVFVDALRAEMVARFGATEGLRLTKPHASHVAPEEWYDNIRDLGGVAIVGWGDCGSCSTCSFLDGGTLIRKGVPTIVVISEAFKVLTTNLAKKHGLENVPRLVLPHPPTGLSIEDLKALARSKADEAAELLGLSVEELHDAETVGQEKR